MDDYMSTSQEEQKQTMSSFVGIETHTVDSSKVSVSNLFQKCDHLSMQMQDHDNKLQHIEARSQVNDQQLQQLQAEIHDLQEGYSSLAKEFESFKSFQLKTNEGIQSEAVRFREDLQQCIIRAESNSHSLQAVQQQQEEVNITREENGKRHHNHRDGAVQALEDKVEHHEKQLESMIDCEKEMEKKFKVLIKEYKHTKSSLAETMRQKEQAEANLQDIKDLFQNQVVANKQRDRYIKQLKDTVTQQGYELLKLKAHTNDKPLHPTLSENSGALIAERKKTDFLTTEHKISPSSTSTTLSTDGMGTEITKLHKIRKTRSFLPIASRISENQSPIRSLPLLQDEFRLPPLVHSATNTITTTPTKPKKRCQHQSLKLHSVAIQPPQIQMHESTAMVDSDVSLHNMELIAEYHAKFSSDKPFSLDWDKYGCRLQIPEGSIPQGEVGTLDIYAIYSGPFKFPEDSSPVSAYYFISLSHDLQKPAILELQHCYIISNDDDAAQLTFASAATSTGPPYHFRPVNGGSFLPGKYAVIHQTKFSIIDILVAHVRAVGQSISRWFNSVQYALSYFLIQVQYPKMWKVKLFITQYTNAHIEYLKQDQERSGNLVDSEYFLFVLEDGVDIVSTLVVPEEDSITDLKGKREKWKTVKKVVMKKWEVRAAVPEVPVVSEPPPFVFRIEWIDELPAESVPFPIRESGSMSYPTETQLKTMDLLEVIEATNEIRDWFTLGLVLKVDHTELKALEQQYHDLRRRRQEMLILWISSGNATWSSLAEALRKPSVNECSVAERIEETYLKQ